MTTEMGGEPVPLGDAAEVLLGVFGPHAELDYLGGKTAFRDELYARFSLSLLEAEELCDALERAGLIAFREMRTGDEESAGWDLMAAATHELSLS